MTVVVAVAIGLWAALDALDDGMIRPSAASDSIPAFAVPLPAPDVPADLPSSQ